MNVAKFTPNFRTRIEKRLEFDNNSCFLQCNAAGCMIELTIQLAVIMVGKQILNAAMELLYP